MQLERQPTDASSPDSRRAPDPDAHQALRADKSNCSVTEFVSENNEGSAGGDEKSAGSEIGAVCIEPGERRPHHHTHRIGCGSGRL